MSVIQNVHIQSSTAKANLNGGGNYNGNVTHTTMDGVFLITGSIQFGENVQIDSDCYFKITNSGVVGAPIIIDGKNNTVTVTVTNAVDFKGLFQNGTNVTDGSSNVTIKNFHIDGNGATLENYYGWLCQRYFSKGNTNTIINCSSSGNITGTGSGGICGSNAGDSNGNLTVKGSYSKGEIGSYAGGICGYVAGKNGNVNIKDCYSKGKIGQYAGGICGQSSGYGGTVNITNCYSTGEILDNAGGICGKYAGSTGGNLTINGCYSIGIIGVKAGGICGSYCGIGKGNVQIEDCYSTGSIGKNAGGICGYTAGYNEGVLTITNCYSTGNIGEENAGGICGSDAGRLKGDLTINECYSTGNIGGKEAGGICGRFATGIYGLGEASGATVNIDNCYSIGIIGVKAGGICGRYAGHNGTVNVTSCHSIHTSNNIKGGVSNALNPMDGNNALYAQTLNSNVIDWNYISFNLKPFGNSFNILFDYIKKDDGSDSEYYISHIINNSQKLIYDRRDIIKINDVGFDIADSYYIKIGGSGQNPPEIRIVGTYYDNSSVSTETLVLKAGVGAGTGYNYVGYTRDGNYQDDIIDTQIKIYDQSDHIVKTVLNTGKSYYLQNTTTNNISLYVANDKFSTTN